MNLRAIKHGQTIQLLDPLDLPDGEITITIQTATEWQHRVTERKPLGLPDGEITITIQTIQPDISESLKSPDAPETFWDAMQKWRATIDWDDWDDSDPWEGVRDLSPGREFSWDD